MDLKPTFHNVVMATSVLLSLSTTVSLASPPPMVVQVAEEQSVPSELFYAIVLAESRSATQQGSKPWPWTMNVAGHPHFFHTREDAYSFASSLVNQGTINFDVGIAQVNWRWHQEKFNHDLWSAFDPYTNLTVAARHFREQYDRPECVEWDGAVGCYHRPARGTNDLRIASEYASRVLKIWMDL